MKNALLDFLLHQGARKPVSFHMPGHKGEDLYRKNGYGIFLDHIMDCDITEIPGADNLFQPETLLREVMDRYRALYDVKRSYLLINGSSGGLLAAILAAVPRDGTLIMARNCHKSVFNGLTLGGIHPAYLYPALIEPYGISGPIRAEDVAGALERHPEAAAVILPSPNYYGVCSDIASIAEEVHKRGKILIVDQAHGAHLKFFRRWAGGFPPPAEEEGADLVVNSIHKTLASFTQTALLNLCSSRIDTDRLEDRLQAVESSSPSYPLMASLEINADLLERQGQSLIQAWNENLKYFYQEAGNIKGLSVMEAPGLDRTKLNLSMSDYGLDGNALEKLLMEEDIYPELTTGDLLMCMTGIGNQRKDFQRLLDSLLRISQRFPYQRKAEEDEAAVFGLRAAREWHLEQRELPAETERIPLEEAAGRVCAMGVIPYPPGIPAVCPGEVFHEEVIRFLLSYRRNGGKVIGLDEMGRAAVGKSRR